MSLAELANLSEKERSEFERVLNRLLSETFLVKRCENTRADYYFVERHEELIREYLSYAGWRLDGDKSYGVYAVASKYGSNRISLRLEESIIVLILRLLYEEKRKEISLSSEVIVRVQEIQDRYLALKIRQRPLGKTVLRDTVRLLKRHNVLEVLDGDAADPETRLLLYPSLLYAVRVESVSEVFAKLNTYGNGEGEE